VRSQGVDVSPYFVDHEEIAIETVPVNMELKRSRFSSGVLEIAKHAPLVRIGAARFRAMLGDDAIGARLVRSRLWKHRQHDWHNVDPLLCGYGSVTLRDCDQPRYGIRVYTERSASCSFPPGGVKYSSKT
jgi:hypothetical protein